VALVHGWLKRERGTISSSISRDQVRRTRMTTRRPGGREAISHYAVQRKLDSPYGRFSLLEVQIDTGRTHQIRVHLALHFRTLAPEQESGSRLSASLLRPMAYRFLFSLIYRRLSSG
jgi:23S rRNA-/tRNA-specific pseudouridylate synthase